MEGKLSFNCGGVIAVAQNPVEAILPKIKLKPKNLDEEKSEEFKNFVIKKEKILRQIGKRIAYYRHLRQLSQLELAQKVFVSPSTIGRIERGKYNNGVSIATLIEITKCLRIDIYALFYSGAEEKNFAEENPGDFIETEWVFRQIGAKIAYYRTLRQWSQLELAQKVELSISTLGKIERGKYKNGVSIATLIKITECLKIDISALFYFTEEEKKILREN